MSSNRRHGFTLIEILVVLGIAAIITSITVAGFSSLRESNRKTTCQTNLTQIYQACRLYSQDFGSFPYYNPYAITAAGTGTGMGLWQLYTTPDMGNPNRPAPRPQNATPLSPPIGTYLKNVTALHCPGDNFDHAGIRTTELYSSQSATESVFNPDYVSYQTADGTSVPADQRYPYATSHPVTPPAEYDPKRQLFYVDSNPLNINGSPPRDNTVVTWCRFHRKLDAAGQTATGSNRNYDNVLFYDGSIQWLPAVQNVSKADATAPGTCEGYNRVPRGLAEKLKDPGACSP